MTVEEALVILETSLEGGRLNRIQEIVFRQVWEGQSYSEIAAKFGYDAGYIKNVASQLWRILSKRLGEKVTKSNVQSVLKRRPYQNPIVATASDTAANRLDFPAKASYRHQDWGAAIDTSWFYGRTAELTTLEQWIVNDCCRLVALLGMGGIGKTALSVKLAQQVENHFEYVIWRSLRHAPPVPELLSDLIQFLDSEQNSLPQSQEYQVSRLIELLRKRRCLLILDNAESILCSGDSLNWDSCALRVGCYLQGYEGYGELFKQIGETLHQSCLVLTAREKPKDIAILEGKSRPVRSLKVRGLGLEAIELLKSKGFSCSEDEIKKLLERYDGNPLVLMIISETIQEVYQGNVSDFLKQKLLIYGGIFELLDRQFSRLSKIEKELISWLAINRASASTSDLLNNMPSSHSQQDLVETLCCLCRRSLIEVSNDNSVLFTVNPLLREYITHRLIKESYKEIFSANPARFNKLTLIKGRSQHYQ